jgi:iron complex transport system permease protein
MPLLGAALVGTALICAGIGAVPLPIGRIVEILGGALAGNPALEGDRDAVVLLSVRLPRVALATLVGAALGISGAAMQGLFRNPLVEPGLLGVSSGAAFGAVAAIVLGASLGGLPAALGPWLLPVAGFAAGLVTVLAATTIARSEGRSSVATLLLAGIALNALAGALTGLCMYLASDAQLRTITFWLLGSLGGASWTSAAALALFLAPALLLLPRFARALNALALGETEASHLGYDVERTRRGVVLLVALSVGAAVALTGVIGFVGLVVPHLVRLAFGADHRVLLPGSALLGAILLLAADALARTAVAPAELPIGILTAATGTPFFLALLVRQRGRFA